MTWGSPYLWKASTLVIATGSRARGGPGRWQRGGQRQGELGRLLRWPGRRCGFGGFGG